MITVAALLAAWLMTAIPLAVMVGRGIRVGNGGGNGYCGHHRGSVFLSTTVDMTDMTGDQE